MLENLKLVVFDYPKYLPKNDTNLKILSDLLSTKQESYHLSDERFVSISGLDFIGTHFMVYDVREFFKPKLILSMRNLFESRIQFHKLKMPTEDYLPKLDSMGQEAFKKFKSNKNPFCESGALYIDADYSYKKTGFPLVELGTMMALNHFIKHGVSHFAAATNVTFKSTKWGTAMGYCEKTFIFEHPYISHPHELLLIEGFNFEWLGSMYEKYLPLWKKRVEIRPENKVATEYTLNDDELESYVLNQMKLLRAA